MPQLNKKNPTSFLHIKKNSALYKRINCRHQQLNQILFKSGKTEFKMDTGGVKASVQK